MSEVMLALGDFKFAINGTQYQQLQTTMAWRWAKKDRFKRKPGHQFHGPESSTKTLEVAIYPQTPGDLRVIARFQAMGDSGKPHRLVSGGSRWLAGQVVPGGNDLGLWVINGLDVREQFFMADGTPLEIKATLTITEYGDDEVFG